MKLGGRQVRGFEDEKGAYFRYRRHWRHRMKFWLIGFLLCVIGAGAALYIKGMFEAVSQVKFLRYEPVDVPPPDVSSRHFKERVENERRNIIVKERQKMAEGRK